MLRVAALHQSAAPEIRKRMTSDEAIERSAAMPTTRPFKS
jgi:hypothetical protein